MFLDLVSLIRLRLKKVKKNVFKNRREWKKLIEKETRMKYQVKVRKRYDASDKKEMEVIFQFL